jgi:hypothetical protein
VLEREIARVGLGTRVGAGLNQRGARVREVVAYCRSGMIK